MTSRHGSKTKMIKGAMNRSLVRTLIKRLTLMMVADGMAQLALDGFSETLRVIHQSYATP